MPSTRAHDLIELENHSTAHNYHPLDVVITRAEGIWVEDVEGKRYVDFLAAYSAVNQGHGHPRIVAALVDQARRLALTSRAFHNDKFGAFCKKLGDLLGYQKVLMMNTGAEAVETAIKAVRRWGYRIKGVPADQAEILVFDGNFHGRTTTIVGFSTDAGARDDYGPFAPGFRVLPYGDLAAVEAAVSERVVAVLVEPIQGENGVIIPPADFLPGLRALCDRHGAMLVCDEIQAGLGRAGAWLAHTLDGVRADAVTVGKALGGGVYPVSAFVADDELMSVFGPGSHGSTFGGNPLACAVADVALDVLRDERLIERAAQLGPRLLARLQAIESPIVRAVRCRGLWAAIDLDPAAGGARRYCNELRDDGLLCKETHQHTIRLAPPLVIGDRELEDCCDKIAKVLERATAPA